MSLINVELMSISSFLKNKANKTKVVSDEEDQIIGLESSN
jgi:hypothetical protein